MAEYVPAQWSDQELIDRARTESKNAASHYDFFQGALLAALADRLEKNREPTDARSES